MDNFRKFYQISELKVLLIIQNNIKDSSNEEDNEDNNELKKYLFCFLEIHFICI